VTCVTAERNFQKIENIVMIALKNEDLAKIVINYVYQKIYILVQKMVKKCVKNVETNKDNKEKELKQKNNKEIEWKKDNKK
jgi:hypothetical protein